MPPNAAVFVQGDADLAPIAYFHMIESWRPDITLYQASGGSVTVPAGGDIAERAAITGALSLYLNFINLVTLLLQLLGQRD